MARDIKSYLSQAYLYFVPTSQKFLILVDNQSWRENNHSRSIRIWGLVVNKYRMSPFRNTKALLRSQSFEGSSSSSSDDERKKLFRWLPVTYTDRWRGKGKAPFSFMDLRKILHGFIVFEVLWKDVRGINYLNQLQTDASIALEVKSMRKLEFHDISQAISCIVSWFSGTPDEILGLHSNLILLLNRVPSCSSRGVTVTSQELIINDTCCSDVFSEDDEFFDVIESPRKSDDKYAMKHQEDKHMFEVQSMRYSDKLLLFHFNEKDLPYKLRQIITSDLRLLTLLESGLPSWVIFLQSYPLFGKIYRPWMRPLARTLYILISLTTLVIGFYDLYKNVPLLKASAFHLCGPFFRWIEEWEMISRIRYLGTMLFLQNFEKAVEWLMMIMRTLKTLVSLLKQPLMDPLEAIVQLIAPLWNIFTETGGNLCYTGWVMVASLCCMLMDLVEILFSPFKFLFSYVLTTVTFISQILYSVWRLLLVPSRVCQMLAGYIACLFSYIYNSTGLCLTMLANNMGQLKVLTQSKPNTSDILFWRSLWKDLLSKVFRSLQSVINSLVAFFSSCNRHRLSTYNYLRAKLWQLSCLLRLDHHGCPCRQAPQIESEALVEVKECDRCK